MELIGELKKLENTVERMSERAVEQFDKCSSTSVSNLLLGVPLSACGLWRKLSDRNFRFAAPRPRNRATEEAFEYSFEAFQPSEIRCLSIGPLAADSALVLELNGSRGNLAFRLGRRVVPQAFRGGAWH